jgi:hypothetical protein
MCKQFVVTIEQVEQESDLQHAEQTNVNFLHSVLVIWIKIYLNLKYTSFVQYQMIRVF